MGQRLAPILLTCRSRGLGEITENRHRTLRTAPADDAKGDCRVVLSFVDDDMTERERRAVEHRVGLVDQELVGNRPPPPLARWTRQHLVDHPDGLLHRPRPAHRRTQLGGSLPDIVTIGTAKHLALHEAAQSFASPVHRRDPLERLVDPARELLGSDHQRSCADRQPQIVSGMNHVTDGGTGQPVEHLRRALPPPCRVIVDAGDLDLRNADVECGALLHQSFSERRKHVGDVVEEHRVRTDDQNPGTRQATTMLEEQEGGAVQAHRGLAGAGSALHHQTLLEG